MRMRSMNACHAIRCRGREMRCMGLQEAAGSVYPSYMERHGFGDRTGCKSRGVLVSNRATARTVRAQAPLFARLLMIASYANIQAVVARGLTCVMSCTRIQQQQSDGEDCELKLGRGGVGCHQRRSLERPAMRCRVRSLLVDSGFAPPCS